MRETGRSPESILGRGPWRFVRSRLTPAPGAQGQPGEEGCDDRDGRETDGQARVAQRPARGLHREQPEDAQGHEDAEHQAAEGDPGGEHGPADEEHRRDDEQGLRPTRWS